MAIPQSRWTTGHYCRRTDVKILLFLISKILFSHGLRDNQFDERAIKDRWKYLTRFYETCFMCWIEGVTDSQIKLRLFGFSLTERTKDWMHVLSQKNWDSIFLISSGDC